MPQDISLENAFDREDRDFESMGTRCAGWLYRPRGTSRPPVVVMAHGFAADRDFGLPAYAERFAARGMAVFVFDYRNFGDSDGEPRNLASPRRHIKDWEAALSHVRALPDVDSDKVALWGSSYSAGHALVIASRDPYVTTIVMQAPFVDGVSSTLRLGIGHALQCLIAAVRDVLNMLAGREPYYIPVAGNPDTLAVLNTAESLPGYLSLKPQGSSWKNECPARNVLELLVYRPMVHAREVKCPALVMVLERDSLINPKVVELAASRMREVTIIHIDAGHFDVYSGELFERAVSIQADFLTHHLL